MVKRKWGGIIKTTTTKIELMDTKQKFVRLKKYNEIIIFPCVLEHSVFKNFDPISAGFCYVNAEKKRVDCFGKSFSLGLEAKVREDTIEATKQIFGIESAIDIMREP